MKVFNWIFAVFCILCLPVYGVHIGSVLMCLLGIASLPVRPVREIWRKLPRNKVLRPAVTGILFVIFCGMLSTGESPADKPAELSMESAAEVQKAENGQTENKQIENKQTENEQIENNQTENKQTGIEETEDVSVSDIPAYSGRPYVEINGNVPQFLETDLSETSYEYYSDLDSLGRCGVVYASIGTDLMPTEERGNIGSVKPTGWHTVKYDIVDGKYLYNRCHLIGYQLSGENANTKNLITGTRYLNVDGMLPFENMVADYVKETGNHVMYRVTPVFEGDNLLASGVQMEAESVEDKGEGILFNVYCYNVQPGVAIDYATGDSSLSEDTAVQSESTGSSVQKPAVTSNESVETDQRAVATGDGAADSGNTDSGTVDSDTTDSGNTDSSAVDSDITDSGNADAENESLSAGSDDGGSVAENTGTGGSGTLMVWKSATGSKYHSINNCGNMNPNKAIQITEEQAISQGLGKCSKCW